MTVYLKKTKSEILNEALTKLTQHTQVQATGPGSVVRSIVESITSEIGDLYDVLDFNVAQKYLSTASGSALDAIGSLYGVQRKSLSDAEAIDKSLGAFMFYISAPHSSDITIPQGTNVYTTTATVVGRQYSFVTAEQATLVAGRTRVYVSLRPNFVDNVFTAAPNKLVVHDAQAPEGVTLLCTNAKAVSPQTALEADGEYRTRIMKQIRVNAAGTSEAVRFAGLAVPQVRDVRVRQNPYGMGSFEVIVVPELGSNTSTLVRECRLAMDEVRPIGSRMFVKEPRYLPVDVSLNVFVPGSTNSQVNGNIVSRVSMAVRRYLSSFLPGDRFVFNRVTQSAFDASNLITDISVSSLSINGIPHLNKNFSTESDEQLVPGNVVVKIASS